MFGKGVDREWVFGRMYRIGSMHNRFRRCENFSVCRLDNSQYFALF